MKTKGTIRLDKKTKILAQRMKPGEIALIDHQDIDSTSAQMLIEARVAAVVNASQSISGRYPNSGPSMLMEAGIPILDNVGKDVFEKITEGDRVEIDGCTLRQNGTILAEGVELTGDLIECLLEECKLNLNEELERFAENTLTYILKERSLLLDPAGLPEISTKIAGKQVLIVVRGEGYKDDLASIRAYMNEVRPVTIGVDGGADALLELGVKPDIILGDMDSISDAALKSGAEIIVHAYADAKRGCPGKVRLEQLGVPFKEAAVPGTSEDLAMLVAYEKGAELLVAVGTHSNLIDFLDKGRRGMSSTFLVRLKVGSRLVDARGVSKLYHGRTRVSHIGLLIVAALIAVGTVIALSPAMRDKAQELFMLVKLWLKIHL